MKKLALGLASATALLLGSALAQPPRPDGGTGKMPPPHAGGAMAQGMPEECACMHGGMMQEGMGHGGPMHGGMHAGAMKCPGMDAIGSVRAENTSTGAVLRFTAKSPAQAAEVQQHVQMMARCMSAHHAAAAGGGAGADGGTPQR